MADNIDRYGIIPNVSKKSNTELDKLVAGINPVKKAKEIGSNMLKTASSNASDIYGMDIARDIAEVAKTYKNIGGFGGLEPGFFKQHRLGEEKTIAESKAAGLGIPAIPALPTSLGQPNKEGAGVVQGILSGLNKAGEWAGGILPPTTPAQAVPQQTTSLTPAGIAKTTAVIPTTQPADVTQPAAATGITPKANSNDILGYTTKTGETALTNMPETIPAGIKPETVLKSKLGIGGEGAVSPAYKAIQGKIAQLEALPMEESPVTGRIHIPKSRQAAITELYKELGTIEGRKETTEAAKVAAQGIGAYHAGELAIKNKNLQLDIAKFAKENDMKDPQNIIKLATSIAPKKTSYDASGATTIEPDVNAGLQLLQKFGYNIGGLAPEKVDHMAKAKAVLTRGAKRKDVEALLKSKGYTDDQIKKGLGE